MKEKPASVEVIRSRVFNGGRSCKILRAKFINDKGEYSVYMVDFYNSGKLYYRCYYKEREQAICNYYNYGESASRYQWHLLD